MGGLPAVLEGTTSACIRMCFVKLDCDLKLWVQIEHGHCNEFSKVTVRYLEQRTKHWLDIAKYVVSVGLSEKTEKQNSAPNKAASHSLSPTISMTTNFSY